MFYNWALYWGSQDNIKSSLESAIKNLDEEFWHFSGTNNKFKFKNTEESNQMAHKSAFHKACTGNFTLEILIYKQKFNILIYILYRYFYTGNKFNQKGL